MKENLIFGYSWDAIKEAQKGKGLGRTVSYEQPKEILMDGDMELFEDFGLEGLKERQFYGVIDRLTRAGVLSSTEDSCSQK